MVAVCLRWKSNRAKLAVAGEIELRPAGASKTHVITPSLQSTSDAALIGLRHARESRPDDSGNDSRGDVAHETDSIYGSSTPALAATFIVSAILGSRFFQYTQLLPANRPD